MREQLEALKSKVSRRAEQKAEFERLEDRWETLNQELFALKIDAHNQQADVDLLNYFSFKNLYYDLTGKKEAMLEKETSEARAAKEKLNSAQFQLDQIARQLELCSNEISSLSGCEAEYWTMLQSASATDTWAITALDERRQEVIGLLEDSINAGNTALEMGYDVLKNIENVTEWNAALSGTAWTLSMPGYLNGTQKKIEKFRKLVRNFCRKLDGLPLPSQAFVPPEEMFVFPENYFYELTGKFGADKRLCEADSAIRRSKDRIFNIQAMAENALKELKAE